MGFEVDYATEGESVVWMTHGDDGYRTLYEHNRVLGVSTAIFLDADGTWHQSVFRHADYVGDELYDAD